MRKIYLDRNLQLIFGVTLMVIMGVSSIIPALPLIMKNFDLTPETIGLVITSFTLPGVFLAPITGILADRIGRKRILVPSLFLFGIAGAACFFAKSLTTLLILRFIQGLGAGPLGVLYGTIIGDLYQGSERNTAMGYNAGVLSTGTAAFPAIGGVLALLGWNWPFLIPILAIPLGFMIMFHLDAPEPETDQNFKEYLHDALRKMSTPRALTLFGVTLLTFFILYGPLITYLPLLLDQSFKASSAAIGMVFATSSLVTAVASTKLGALTRRYRPIVLLRASFVFYLLGMALMPFMPGIWAMIIPVVLFGFGQGLNIPTVMSMLAGLAPIEQRAAFMAANGTLLRLSQTIAPPLFGLVYGWFGMTTVFMAGAGCAAMMLILTLNTRRVAPDGELSKGTTSSSASADADTTARRN